MIRFKQLVPFIVTGLCSITSLDIKAQGAVGIGVLSPDPSSILEIQPPGGNAGLIIPRVDKNNILTPAEGLLTYDVIDHDFYFYESKWQLLGTPEGGIIMWSGAINDVPNGWALCDGTKGTADLSGRFIITHDPSDFKLINNPKLMTTTKVFGPDAVIGNTGGTDLVTLKALETGIPAHDHTINHGHSITDNGHIHRINNLGNEDVADANKQNAYNRNNNAFKDSESTKTNVLVNARSGNSGSNAGQNASQSHENRPQYYVLAFIQRL